MKGNLTSQLQIQKAPEQEYSSLITRKGQVTIPIEIRRFLSFSEGDRVSFVLDTDRRAFFKKSTGAVVGTAGMLKTRKKPLTAEKMRELAELEIAKSAVERS